MIPFFKIARNDKASFRPLTFGSYPRIRTWREHKSVAYPIFIQDLKTRQPFIFMAPKMVLAHCANMDESDRIEKRIRISRFLGKNDWPTYSADLLDSEMEDFPDLTEEAMQTVCKHWECKELEFLCNKELQKKFELLRFLMKKAQNEALNESERADLLEAYRSYELNMGTKPPDLELTFIKVIECFKTSAEHHPSRRTFIQRVQDSDELNINELAALAGRL